MTALRVSFCPSCEWRHKGDEKTGIELKDGTYTCHLTKKKVHIEDADTYEEEITS
jgi:hypothetical protein